LGIASHELENRLRPVKPNFRRLRLEAGAHLASHGLGMTTSSAKAVKRDSQPTFARRIKGEASTTQLIAIL
jgi:hypothetical protein